MPALILLTLMQFNVIIITSPNYFNGETSIINDLFGLGMHRLHLRKPGSSKEEMMKWLEQIKPEFRNKIVLHDYHDLTPKYNLGGIHINSRNPEIPSWASDYTISRSCHSIDEIQSFAKDYDYVFLSPIFDSISKEGYKAAFSFQQLKAVMSYNNVIALGGVSLDNIQEVKKLGFSGGAILGDLWEKPLSSIAEHFLMYDSKIK